MLSLMTFQKNDGMDINDRERKKKKSIELKKKKIK